MIDKSLKKIDKSIKTQVFKKIDKILKRPYEIGEAKSQDLKHIRAVHIYGGSYVLLFKVDDKQNIVFFLCLNPMMNVIKILTIKNSRTNIKS